MVNLMSRALKFGGQAGPSSMPDGWMAATATVRGQPIAAVSRALHRRQARHVPVIGARGVGKTTLVTEVARRAAT
jgi:flagellar biosynthesis GTPase FlhF